MNLSLITLFPLMHNQGRLPQEALFAQIKQAGFQAVDLCGYDFASLTEAEVRSALQRLGLKAACYIDFVPSPAMGDAEAGARVKAHIRKGLERTEALGAAVYMFAPSGYADAVQGVPRREVADALAEDLAYTVQLAAPKGISVVIEDAPDITFPMCSAEEVLYLLRKVPGLRHVFDTGNMLAAGEDPVGFYEQTKGYLTHVHLKDMRFTDGAPTPGYGEGDLCADGRRMVGVLHGEGVVDFPALLSRIKQSRFGGYMGVEYVPQGTDADYLAELTQCRETLERFWENA